MALLPLPRTRCVYLQRDPAHCCRRCLARGGTCHSLWISSSSSGGSSSRCSFPYWLAANNACGSQCAKFASDGLSGRATTLADRAVASAAAPAAAAISRLRMLLTCSYVCLLCSCKWKPDALFVALPVELRFVATTPPTPPALMPSNNPRSGGPKASFWVASV